MNGKRIAIACQGGGSQCAFIAGALKALFANDVHRRFKIVGLSGTSGGAITAALAWVGMLKQAHGDSSAIEDRIIAFWHDLSAQTPQEMILDRVCVQLLRLAKTGLMPTVESSPSSAQFRFWSQAASALISRPAFTDLGALLARHLDFDELPSLVEPDSPVLLVGAADVLEGTFKLFSSARGEIRAEAVLASAAIPNLFPAVWVDGHPYWDGIFSSNPPVFGFLQKVLVGMSIPQEIWILQVNPSRFQTVPENPSEIFDRRNHLAGNLSLRHELQLIQMVNFLLEQGALTDEFRARFGLDANQPIKVRFIRMSEELQHGLDYPSKLSRQPHHIARLIADGEAQATAFLSDLEQPDRPSEFNGGEVRVESH
jgi:NTE family protein